ncbi:MAG: nuclear transport factor 2 family protein [Candidatus Aminicenantales bacterium]|jgi:beta-aspartyl-peptidase (threonine type)
MKKFGILIIVVFSLAAMMFGQASPTAEKEIRAALDLQKTAWNRGDIEGFMATYWKSDALTFQSAGSRTHGWDDVLARYKKNYAPGKMGKLDFTDLAIHILSRDAAYVLGRFKLDFGGTLKEGVFTLIFRRTKDGWRIIHDHTSSS